MKKNNERVPNSRSAATEGFTLLEILIALFIFTLLSLMLVNALRSVIDSLTETENKALRLRNLQMAMLVISRDIEQTVNRPIVNNAGKQDPAFIGKAHSFTFTHTGMANSVNIKARSTLERTAYQWSDQQLSKLTWAVLDQPPKSQPDLQTLLSDVSEAHFEYLDRNGRFYNEWPLSGQGGDPLPRGIRIYLTLTQWGSMTALYLIPTQISPSPTPPGQTPPGQTPPPTSPPSTESKT